jgi:hypothetical protein
MTTNKEKTQSNNKSDQDLMDEGDGNKIYERQAEWREQQEEEQKKANKLAAEENR